MFNRSGGKEMLRKSCVAALLLTALSAGAAAQNNAAQAVAAASKAMGADTLNSITFSGTARNGQFGQSRQIANPLGPTNTTVVTQYTRTVTFAPTTMGLVSRATGPTQPPTVPGVPAPMPGVFNQNINAMQASGQWAQALNVWLTPWGCLKGAAANNATVRAQGGNQLVTWSPAAFKSPSGLMYSVTCTINNQNLVTKAETRVENTVVGDMLVEFDYSNYRNLNGVQVPGRVVQRQAGMEIFNADITAATANPANLTELLTPPQAPAGGPGGAPPAGPPAAAPPQAAGPTVERLGDGVFKIGGNHTALAVDMGDHILVVESGQSDARGMAVMAAAKQAIPNKPIRFVVNSHPHFDHASGLRAAAAEGATILMGQADAATMQRLLSQPSTLSGDSLSKQPNRRVTVQGIGDREIRRGTNGKVVEIHRITESTHNDSHLMVYLPAERVIHTADVPVAGMPNPNQRQILSATLAAAQRLNLQWDSMIPSHPTNPERVVPRAEIQMLNAPPATN
jgi:glyoxylase-like metal-dependent hydrolase (beta-lactamase superfamily II)